MHDLIIVGAGTAGAVLASRLSENSARRVLLLEAGPDYDPHSFPYSLTNSNAPGGDDRHDWGYISQPGWTYSPIQLRRGRVVGGSSATNAAVAIRARSCDFDRWQKRGITGWSFSEVLDTFKRLENTPSGEEQWHGRTGPFPIRQPSLNSLTPACQAFIAASQEIGLKQIDDFNGAEQHGAGAQPRNVVGGVRQNTGMVYLTDSVRGRPNLRIGGGTEVDQVIFEGHRAAGVRLVDGSTHFADEIILSAGVYGSAAILMRSGIGPADDLRPLGIPVIEDLPIGRRLSDHPFVYTVHALVPNATDMKPAVGALAWTRSQDAAVDDLDLQIVATHFFDPALSPTGGAIVLAVAVTLPDSIGRLTLATRDPRHPPRIDLNFLAATTDRDRLVEGIELARKLARSSPLKEQIHCELTAHADLLSSLRTYHHACCTVPMGAEDDMSAAVNSLGAVRGVAGLRVVDPSIFPDIPSAPTNLTVVMAAEHIASRIS